MSVATHLKLDAYKTLSYVYQHKCLLHTVTFIEIIMMLSIREGMNVKSFLGRYIHRYNENIRVYRDPYIAR